MQYLKTYLNKIIERGNVKLETFPLHRMKLDCCLEMCSQAKLVKCLELCARQQTWGFQLSFC